MNNSQDIFFALVRVGLWNDGTLDLEIDGDTDWSEVYRLAQEQSVLGLVLAGLESSDAKPPQELLLQWIGQVQILEQRNLAMNKFIAELIEKLRRADVYTLLLKGQGIAQCYERPLWRCCGDVDLLLSEDNYDRAKKLLVPIASEVEKEYVREKHLGMTINDFVVELHGTLYSGLTSKIEKGLDEIKRAIFFEGRVRSWMNGNTQVFSPNANEDVVYVFTHMLQHFFKEGLGLRQVCDWCRLLRTYKDSLNYGLLVSRIRKMGLMSEWRAFAAFAVDYLGMPSEAMPLYSPDKKWKRKADKISIFILEVGNMGHKRGSWLMEYDSWLSRQYVVRKAFSMFRRIGDLINHARIFPLDSLRFFPRIMFNGVRSAMRGE